MLKRVMDDTCYACEEIPSLCICDETILSPERWIEVLQSKLHKCQDEQERTRNLLVAIVQSLKAGNSAEEVLETIRNFNF